MAVLITQGFTLMHLSSANTQRSGGWYQEILMVQTSQHGVRAHGNILAQAMSGSGIEAGDASPSADPRSTRADRRHQIVHALF
jgi:hypothetical protein